MSQQRYTPEFKDEAVHSVRSVQRSVMGEVAGVPYAENRLAAAQ